MLGLWALRDAHRDLGQFGLVARSDVASSDNGDRTDLVAMTAASRGRYGLAILLAAVIAFWAFVTAPAWWPLTVSVR